MSEPGEGIDKEAINRDKALAFLREDIGRRIRPLVAHLPEAEVAALIERMVCVKYKYGESRRITPATSFSRST